ncbi:hypothetical protein VMCG_08675 [Cytospora schulzeri]|uniref:Aldehyde dehydrogenase domain-containing protein n=1 Tax=Cytospora schulzeri TaxID=448051 RepID=A0A423VTA7_9PEZI|nr:hypothetical protein VMCG_08675 [Valsa malicola]
MGSNATQVATTTKGATVPFWIGGKEVISARTFDVYNPALGKVAHKCSSATGADAQAAVDAAAKALPAWKAMVPTKRREIFLRAAELLEKRRDELATTMVEELGVARQWADFNITTAKDFTLDVAGRTVTIEGSAPTPQDPNTGAMVVKEPFGVVLAIAPWNAPYILGTRSVIFPMAAGNTVVFKGSELSPKTMWGICSVFAEAGLPDGVLNYIVHETRNAAAITEQLIASPPVKKVNFTGSTLVGRVIGRLAGENLKPVLLELGGKAPAVVWEDADLDLAADQCALGAFLNAGQICMSTERIIVHRAVRDVFERKLLASVDRFFPGAAEAPLLIHEPAVEKNKKLLRDARDKGATLLLNRDFDDEAGGSSGPARLRPTVVKGVTEDMDLYRTESFGPIVSLYEVETEEEALRLANDTEYGLTSAVFTEDLRRGLRFAKGIETGACHINSMSVHDESALPHGGANASGYGRFCGSGGLEEWVRTKTITYRW